MSILDSRDLEEELKNPHTEEERKKAIKQLKKETENYGWEHGIIFISEMEWEDYCQNFAEDCGYLDNTEVPTFITNHIDWESVWSRELRFDYFEVDGHFFTNNF